jgi:hypothetical protein
MRVERGKGNLELPGRGCDGADGRGGHVVLGWLSNRSRHFIHVVSV